MKKKKKKEQGGSSFFEAHARTGGWAQLNLKPKRYIYYV